LKIGPLSIQVIPVASKVRLVNGRPLAVAMFVVDGMGVGRNERVSIPNPVPSIHAPMFRDDLSRISSVVVCRQDDMGVQAFLLFHELLHAAVWLLHFPARTHFWIDKIVRSQVLDTPCPPGAGSAGE
jgi:hypothetical protein